MEFIECSNCHTKIRNDVLCCPYCNNVITVADTSFSEFLAAQPIAPEIKETISDKWKLLEIISCLVILAGFAVFFYNIESGFGDGYIQLGLGMMILGLVSLGFDQLMVWLKHRQENK